jgi:hypothetical protein
VANYLNTLPIGGLASVTRVAQHAYGAAHQLQNVSNILLNGASVDIAAPATSVIKAGQIVVSTSEG